MLVTYCLLSRINFLKKNTAITRAKENTITAITIAVIFATRLNATTVDLSVVMAVWKQQMEKMFKHSYIWRNFHTTMYKALYTQNL